MLTLKSIIPLQAFLNKEYQVEYQVKKGYQLFCWEIEKKYWSKEVWARLNIPKHSCMMWLAIKERMKTKHRLKKMGIIDNVDCFLCGIHEETVHHLNFDYVYMRKCLK